VTLEIAGDFSITNPSSVFLEILSVLKHFKQSPGALTGRLFLRALGKPARQIASK